jgi:hypothetical protein
MVKGPPPIQVRRDCRFDHLVAAGLTKGYGTVLVYSGIPSLERGHEIRRGVYRCARHRGVSVEAGPSRLVTGDEMGLRPDGAEFELRFRLWTKTGGRARILDKHGTDRANWPYDTRRAKNQDDVDYWASLGLNEKGHRVE